MKKTKHMMRRYFIGGLLIWVPIWVTLLVLKFMVDLLDKVVDLIPHAYQPAQLIGFDIPGLGVVLVVLLLFFTGMLAANFIGRWFVAFSEGIFVRIPLVRSIYKAVKQVMNSLFSTSGESFRRVLLVEYPRKGLWSIAFQTSRGFTEAKEHIGEELVTIFIPTTPNPTSGFLMMIPAKDAVELKISVEAALRMVISLGVVLPEEKVKELVQES